ncbi:probable disease resistance protein At5g63020 [Mangifera indica]|uniref:probable disease resistance protein At5g63020 n=1 Tax=Mangifera indica TaxID=29780 RepID=UPI001CF96828|nr:probable disease resistance protein At5g63020 [Mangifera indica]XP_044481528.1 probable disease resistance protein At5g63020 [Mangifera indica]
MGNCNSVPKPAEDAFSAALSSCAGYISKKSKYKKELRRNICSLEAEANKLVEVKDDVHRRVHNEEKQPRRERLRQVQGWLTRAESTVPEANKLVKDGSAEVDRLCLGGFFYKNKKYARFSTGKRVGEMLADVRSLKKEGLEFTEVADRILNDPVDDKIPCETTVGLESTVDEVLRCYEEDQVKIIGLYGGGGVGKTAVLNQIYNRIRETSADITLIRISATNKKLENIQDEIGEKLLLSDESWKSKTSSEKAMEIHRNLKRKKLVLLIDDLWEWIDLTKAGIPLSDSDSSTKVVFTTRLVKNGCGRMIKVECLDPGDAWELFQSRVGDWALKSHPEIRELAKTMAKECCGLPLALIKVAEAMTQKKTPQEWDYAINEIQTKGHEYSAMQEVYKILRSSYDNLPEGSVIKSCFLYFGLFPKNHVISRMDLIDCWIGEGFLADKSVAQNKGYHIIGILLNAGLLEEEDEDRVKINGISRDLALWINKNCKGKDNVLVNAGNGLREAPEAGEWEGVRRMSVMKNQIEILPETPPGHCLDTLFLNDNKLKVINGDFFRFIHRLTVLRLSNNPFLTKLPPEIANSVSLQLLDLSRTSIKELPEELKALSNLRCLNLQDTPALETIPQGLISNFAMLQVLRMFGCGALRQNGLSLVEEVLSLQRLDSLDITINGSPALERLLTSPRMLSSLESVCLRNLTPTRSIKVRLFNLTKKLRKLDILNCDNLEEMQIDCEDGTENPEGFCGFRHLCEVNIKSCSKLKDLTWLILAPCLRGVEISDCPEIEELISAGRLIQDFPGVSRRLPFEKLESLVLNGLENLKSINQTALPFQKLKKIEVKGCPQLKTLPLDSESAKEGRILIEGEQQWWDELQWKEQAARSTFDPCFQASVVIQIQ